MDYFPRKSLSKYLITDTIISIDIDIFINDKWRKYAGGNYRATLQNYRATWTSLLDHKESEVNLHKVTSSPSSVSP